MSRRPPLPSLNSSIPKGMANSQGAAASSGPPSRRQQQSLNAILPSLQRSNAASAAPATPAPPSSSGPPPRQQQSLNLNALQRSTAAPSAAQPRQEQNSNPSSLPSLPSLQRSVAAQAPPPPSAAIAPVQPSSAAPSDSGAGVQGPLSSAMAANIRPQELFLSPPSRAEPETDFMSQEAESAALQRQSRPLLSNFSSSGTFNSGPANSPSTASLIPGLSREQQDRRGRRARMVPPASAASAQVLTRENAVSGADNALKSMVSTIAIGTPASPLQPSTPRMFEESSSLMDRASKSGIDYTPFEPTPTRQALFSSPPPSSADQSIKIRSLEKQLEECYKKVELRENLLKNQGSKNVAKQEQIRVLEQQLQQARQAQQDQIKVLEQQLQQARQAQQVLDDDAISSNATSASFGSATSNPYNNDDAEGGKRKTKFKKYKKMYNKTSKKYNKTSKKYKNKKARY